MPAKKFDYDYKFSGHALKKYLIKTGKAQGWLNDDANKKLLVAVSGGGDSVALLWLFKNFYDGEVLAVHINHKLRGQNSDDDAKFVRELAEKWDVKFFERVVNVQAEKFNGESIETAARRLRYNELINIAKSENVYGVLLGHNQDDLAETVLFNLVRGAGVRGGVGIPETNIISGVKIFRPLINLSREFLRELLRTRDITWREDNSNLDTNYTRNFIRLEILPAIQNKINSCAIEHIANFAHDLSDFRNFEEDRGHEILTLTLVENDNSSIKINVKKLKTYSLHEIKIFIRTLGRDLNLKTLSRGRCDELANLILTNGRFIFEWGGAVVNVAGGFLICRKF